LDGNRRIQNSIRPRARARPRARLRHQPVGDVGMGSAHGGGSVGHGGVGPDEEGGKRNPCAVASDHDMGTADGSRRPATLPVAVPATNREAWGDGVIRLRQWQRAPKDLVESKAAEYQKRGFVIIEGALEAATANNLLNEINEHRSWFRQEPNSNWRNAAGTRYSLNSPTWKFSVAWQYALFEILEGPTRRYLDAITGGDENIVIDRLGGDVVEAGCVEEQELHDDWPNLTIPAVAQEAAIGVSLAVTDITAEMGSIEIVPADLEKNVDARALEDAAVACTMEKGDVLIRDIRRTHRGGVNTSEEDRVLPGFTLLTRVPRMMKKESLQQTQLRWRDAGRQLEIPPFLRRYFTGIP
jgi:hypothetical protein